MRAVVGLLFATMLVLSLSPQMARAGETSPFDGPDPAESSGTEAAESPYWTPQLGDAERKPILDALRPEIEEATIGPVRFVVEVLRTDGEWAYIQAIPQRRGGQPLEWWSTPRFAEAWKNGDMSEIVMGLVRYDDEEGEWVLVDHVIGPTDVHWYNWIDEYGLPEALFSG